MKLRIIPEESFQQCIDEKDREDGGYFVREIMQFLFEIEINYHLGFSDYCLHLYCYFHNVSADMSSDLLQVFVELEMFF